MKNKKLSLEQKAPLIAMSIAFVLAIIKFGVWIISGSIALLSSAIDSLLDSWVSLFNYFALKISGRKANNKYNYWHWKIEWIAATIEWTIIIISWLYIIYSWVIKIMNPVAIEYINWTILVMIISILLTWSLVYFLNYVYKQTNNLVIKWDALHYKMDLFTNIAIVLILVILYFFPSLSLIDWILWILIWIYIIKESYNLVKEWINLLLDKRLDNHKEIKKIIKKYKKEKLIHSFHDFKTRSGWSNKSIVEFHFVLDKNTTIYQAHIIWDKITNSIKKLNNKYSWNIIYHVDYYDDSK